MSEPKTAEVKVADLAEFMRTGSGKVALSREIVAQIERVAKSKEVKYECLTGATEKTLYACPAATQSLLNDEGVDLLSWLCDEASSAIGAQAGSTFTGDWSIRSASLMRDPYSAKPYVLFYVEADAMLAASPPAETGEGEDLDLYHDKVQETISWTMRQWGEALGLKSWTQGDGTETVEGDVGAEIINILTDAGLYDREDGTFAKLAQPVSPSEGEAVAWRTIGPTGAYEAFTSELAAQRRTRESWGKPVEPLYTHPAADQSDTERMREAASKAYRACQSAWSCGEPPHRVKDMLDAMDALGVVLGEPGAALAEKAADQSAATGEA